MESFKNALEAYKHRVVDEVLRQPEVRDHVQTMYRNLIQPERLDEPVSVFVDEAVARVAHAIVGFVIDHANAKIHPEDNHLRETIVSRVDDLMGEFERSSQVENVKSMLRVACIQTLGLERPRSPAALIRFFDQSFWAFFNVVAQASMYLINGIDIRHMAMTDEELARFQASLARAVRVRGGEVTTLKTPNAIEDMVDELKRERNDRN